MAAALLLFCAAAAHADLTITQIIEELRDASTSGKEQMTFLVSGRRLRIDQGQRFTSIILKDRRVTFAVNHVDRTYTRLAHGAPAAETPPAPWKKMESTGRKETISGFKCHEVRVQEPDGTATELWVSGDALDPKTFSAEYAGYLEFGMAGAMQMMDKHPEIRGVFVRLSEYEDNKLQRRATVQKLSREKIPDSAFEVPAGYTETRMDDGGLPPTPPPGKKP